MINNYSRFNYATRLRVRDGSGDLVEPEHYDIRPRITKTDYPDNTEYQPTVGDNWSRIAWKTLGDGQLYWVIADFSQVVDPFSELIPQVKARYLTRLTADVAAGEQTTLTLANARTVRRGLVLRIEDIDPTHNVYADIAVQDANQETGVVNFSPVTFPTGGVPALYSRVSVVQRMPVRLTVPTPQRTLLQALDFKNPLNTIEE